MNAQSLAKCSLTVVAAIIVAGCGATRRGDIQQETGSSSAVQSIAIQGIDSSQVQVENNPNINIRQLLNGFALQVVPSQEVCQTPMGPQPATKINTVGSLQQGMVPSQLTRGCDYQISMAIGSVDASNNFTPYFQSQQPTLVSAAQLSSGQAPMVRPQLAMMPAAMQMGLRILGGLGGGLGGGQGGGQGGGFMPPLGGGGMGGGTPPLGGPIGGGNGGQPGGGLNQQFNVAVRGFSGQMNLDQIVKGRYVVLKLSRAGCGGCQMQADAMARDQELLRALSSGTCSKATIVPNLQEWSSAYGYTPQSVVGQSSFEFTGGLRAFASALGISVPSTPWIIMMEKTQDGRLVPVGQGGNAWPRQEILSRCR